MPNNQIFLATLPIVIPYKDNPLLVYEYNGTMMENKQLTNLKPFIGGDDPRRQNGRKKGQINRKTAIKKLLEQEIDPKMLIVSNNGEFLEDLKDKTYIEAIIYTLINQAINKDVRASDLLLRELRYIDDKYPSNLAFNRDIKIEIVNPTPSTENPS